MIVVSWTMIRKQLHMMRRPPFRPQFPSTLKRDIDWLVCWRKSSRCFNRVSRESLNPHPVKLYIQGNLQDVSNWRVSRESLKFTPRLNFIFKGIFKMISRKFLGNHQIRTPSNFIFKGIFKMIMVMMKNNTMMMMTMMMIMWWWRWRCCCCWWWC